MELIDLDDNTVNFLSARLVWFRNTGISVATSIPETKIAINVYNASQEWHREWNLPFVIVKGVQNVLRADYRIEPSRLLRRQYKWKAGDILPFYLQTDTEVHTWWIHVNSKAISLLKDKDLEFFMLYWFVSPEPPPYEIIEEGGSPPRVLSSEEVEELGALEGGEISDQAYAISLTDVDGYSRFHADKLITQYDHFLESSYYILNARVLSYYIRYQLYLEGYVVRLRDILKLGYTIQEMIE